MPSNTTTHRNASLSRFTLLTAVATPLNLLLLGLTISTTDLAPAVANLLVGATMTIPSYIVSVQWVWRGAPRVPARATHFWLASAANIALASATMWGVTASRTVPRPVVTIVPLVVYAVTWGLRYLWLDRRLFASSDRANDGREFGADGDLADLSEGVTLEVL